MNFISPSFGRFCLFNFSRLHLRAVHASSRAYVLRTLLSAIAILAASAPSVSHAFTSGCAPPSIPNFSSGNQYAQNLAIPPAGFGLSSRPASCPDYTNVRINPMQTLPPGVSLQLVGSTNQAIRFTGTPTTVGDFGNLSIEVTENGTTWAAALSVRFVVAACLDWNTGNNQRFRTRYPGGESYFTIPTPQSGVAYTFSSAALPDVSSATPSENYPATAYCPVATWEFEYDTSSGDANLPMTNASPAPLAFTISGTPTASGDGSENACGTPDGSPDAVASGRDALGNVIASLRFCFGESEPPIVSIGAILPTGTVGIPYNGSLTSNGVPALTFALLSGALPPGLALASDGAISGTPTQSGSFPFAASVTAQNGTANGNFSIVVNAAQTANPTSQAVPVLGIGGLFALALGALGLAMRASRRKRH
jgi:hypothetical protein